jgi:hypothetical protein
MSVGSSGKAGLGIMKHSCRWPLIPFIQERPRHAQEILDFQSEGFSR